MFKVKRFIFVFTFLLINSYVANSRETNKYAFLVGIQEYDKRHYLPLPSSSRDLVEMYKSLTEIGFRKENILAISDATFFFGLNEDDLVNEIYSRSLKKYDIIDELRSFLQVKKLGVDDILVVYLTGHGASYSGHRLFASSDANTDYASSYLNLSEIIQELLQHAKFANKLLIFDACANEESKMSGNGLPQWRSTEEAGVEQFYSSQLKKPSRVYKKYNVSLFSYYFTQAIKKAVEGPFGNNDKEIKTDEVYTYIFDEMAKIQKNNSIGTEKGIKIRKYIPQVPSGLRINPFTLLEKPEGGSKLKNGICDPNLKGLSKDESIALLKKCLVLYENS